MNTEHFEAELYNLCKTACKKSGGHPDDEVVIAYEGKDSIIATRHYIKQYHPDAEIISQ